MCPIGILLWDDDNSSLTHTPAVEGVVEWEDRQFRGSWRVSYHTRLDLFWSWRLTSSLAALRERWRSILRQNNEVCEIFHNYWNCNKCSPVVDLGKEQRSIVPHQNWDFINWAFLQFRILLLPLVIQSIYDLTSNKLQKNTFLCVYVHV